MTAIQSSSALPGALPTKASIIGRIAGLAFPLMIGSLVAASLHMLKTAILSFHGDEAALYTLSMVQPAFIFMLAFLEALAITNQVFSSKSVNNWPRGDVRRSTLFFSIVGMALVAVLAAGFYTAPALFGGHWPEGKVLLPDMARFVVSLAPYLLFELRNGALRGQGRTGLALMPFVILAVTDALVTYVCVSHYDLGFDAVLIGNAAGPLVALPLVSWLLHREIGKADTGPAQEYRKHLIGLCIGVAGPVFASIFVGSASAAIIFPGMARLGQDFASGFLVIVRMRILFIIPAIAIGSAIAILVNQMPEQGHQAEKRATLRTGVAAVLCIYVLASLAVYAARFQLISLVVPQDNAGLFAATSSLMSGLIPTFFLTAGFTMLQVILEHLGLGVKVLVITIVIEALTVALALYALSNGAIGLVLVMNVLAALSLVIFAAVFASFTSKMERHDAV